METENPEVVYYHVRVILYDKPALYDAIRDCFMGKIEECSLMMSMGNASTETQRVSGEKCILTQQDQLRDNRAHAIVCSPTQIMLYAHNCITLPTLRRILDGENP